MSTSPEALLGTARGLAAAGRWRELAELTRPHSEVPDLLGGELILLHAEALARTGLDLEAYEWLSRTVELLVQRGDQLRLRQALNLLGVVLFGLGMLDDATRALDEALDLANQSADLLLFARTANNLGAISNVQGRHELALSHYRLAIPAYQQLGNRRGIAETHHNIAITYRDLGNLAESEEHERKAGEYACGGTAPRIVVMSRIGRAELAMRHGDYRLAEMSARTALGDLEQLDDPATRADAYRLLGVALGAQQLIAAALEAFAQALSIAVAHGHALTEAECLRDRAATYRALGDVSCAAADARRAIVLFTRLGALIELERLELLLASVT